MTNQITTTGTHVVIAKHGLNDVFKALVAAGYTIIGPTVREAAIVYDEITKIEDLPIGWTDDQGPGQYRLRQRGDGQYFGYVVGPHSWKQYLYPPTLKLFTAIRNEDGFELEANQEAPQYAFIGVRSCELAAIGRQDRIFLKDAFYDPHYRARRERAFILATNCTEPGETCFCVSMQTGPKCNADFDLALTELENGFLLEVGSELGAEMLADCDWRPAGAFELNQARRLLAQAETQMGRTLDTRDLPDLLYNNLNHSHWNEVAEVCLSCMNCTTVCPTCFCVDVQEVSDLTGHTSERIRVWDSCFNPDFSYIHGGNLRPNIRSRYRQWLTHKLASWIDQFGTSGCVGCGRCITWCPVGIDLTKEVAALRGGENS